MKYSHSIIISILVTFSCFHICCYCDNKHNIDNLNNNNNNLGNNYNNHLNVNDNDDYKNFKSPTVLIALLIRNKGHVLPYFFSYLENLDYPKNRLALWIRSDHNEDNTIDMIHLWLNRTSSQYHLIDFKYSELPKKYKNESSANDWVKERFSNLINLKENALKKANQIWADYIFYLDADIILTNPNTLKYLIKLNLQIVSPMLLSDSSYSNFWCGMTDTYYYQRTDEYKEIYNYKKIGTYNVPMIHSAVLINLNYINSTLLTFDKMNLINLQKSLINHDDDNNKNLNLRIYDGPIDDIIIFAISALTLNITLNINNEYNYGYILLPLELNDTIRNDLQQLINIKLNIINDLNQDIKINKEFKNYIFYPEKHKLSLDHIYMINLKRRTERRQKMEASFKELGLDVKYFPAIDGRDLNLTVIKNLGIKLLPGYKDPYHRRQMTMGEIGCFLSHYYIWKKMIDLEQNEVLILEDDIRFESYFYDKAINVLKQARNVGGWDLIYFGRKRLEDQEEPWVDGTYNLVHVGYSYWTIGYVLTLNGAKKLINSEPLKNLLPVDEYLPIMFDRHPNDTWSRIYKIRNLNAFSAAPLLLYPTHYTGDDGYISDTEYSEITPSIQSIQSSNLTKDEDQHTIKNEKNSKCTQNTNFLFIDDEQSSSHHFDGIQLENNDFKNRVTKSIGKRSSSEL